MRVLIFGGTGMLGHTLLRRMAGKFDVWTTIRGSFSDVERYGIYQNATTIENVEAGDIVSVSKAFDYAQPEIVINAVGLIKHKFAESARAQTIYLNSTFPQRLAEISSKRGARFITISTDCVFDGKKGLYTEEDHPDASDLYGTSKAAGEVAEGDSLVIRTSIIGRELNRGHSIVEWFLRHRGGIVNGFTKAIYSGFPSIVLADIISDIIRDHTGLRGLYHISSDPISKFDLLCLLNKHYNPGIEIAPSEDLVIDRSLDSSRFRQLTGFVPRSWDEMIFEMASDPFQYDDLHRGELG
jgi:dTDP-4-dehydrorhamnose reductase